MLRCAFESFDGTPIAYYQWGQVTATPPVVLLHGFAANAEANWVAPGVVAALTEAGRQVVAMDARGHGDSGKSDDPRHYGDGTMSRDLSCLFDVLGVDGVHLAGYSLGAVVSLITAAQDARVRRLVLGGIGGDVVRPADGRTRSGAAVSAALLADDTSTLPPAGAGVRALADRVGADRPSLAAAAGAGRSAVGSVDLIAVATLVLVGEDDQLATRPELLAEAIGGAELRLVPGGHLSAVSETAFAKSIVDFFTEQEPTERQDNDAD
ncbi:MAG TPA: alpha/beta hydrolase [Pseudonocardiaceae bacterium]|jgi:pimeloyl-ACP methyl ester carboxylesterase|nr:alpha/beta hydrolase [Pseudonocardiaceae bacterium]